MLKFDQTNLLRAAQTITRDDGFDRTASNVQYVSNWEERFRARSGARNGRNGSIQHASVKR